MSLRSCATATVTLSAVIVLWPFKSAVSGQQPAKTSKTAASESRPAVRFTDIRESAGINFVQDSTQTEEKYYLETMGTGVAWIDYDQDGLMDLYFVQSAATDAYKPKHPLHSALYHNNGDGTFTDVIDKAHVGGEEHY
jgi:enediyne biosynthesis protein E4